MLSSLVRDGVLTGQRVMAIVESLRRAAERTGKPVLVTRTGADFLAPHASGAMRAARLAGYPTPARAGSEARPPLHARQAPANRRGLS